MHNISGIFAKENNNNLKFIFMSLVGKKFPSIAVDAISEMGDNLKINIFEEATKYDGNWCFL